MQLEKENACLSRQLAEHSLHQQEPDKSVFMTSSVSECEEEMYPDWDTNTATLRLRGGRRQRICRGLPVD
eukprot:CAMPEP_0181305680 /NCGR_PEP_ID=MMETSP1101-20121128/9871_1 /TAXON_ID=46948 /ORGANISM="Rhodomonas abbreviata, Strain Caron Lab Isolate" /LENGTH=69 /DNA_ID=CAMNT_0023411637 /DNA_START=384 /DNA_END=593 /DNA_ORIENTATION=-